MAQSQERDAQNAEIRNTKEMAVKSLVVEMAAKDSGIPVEQVLAIKTQPVLN